LERLHFTARARRRALRRRRLRRLQTAIVVASVSAAVLQVPGSLRGFEALEHLVAQQGLLRAVEADGVETTRAAASTMRFRHRIFGTRPDPTPSPTEEPEEAEPQPAVASGSITDIVRAAAAEFGLSGDYLMAVASCESGLNPGAYNPAGYHGLFQFDQQTWAAYGYGSIWDPAAQARTAARLLAAGQASRWPNCA
jgi:soluble lytic murein transglycosylase-like protein